MRVVNREEFMELPEGTLFHHYNSPRFEGLYIKGETIKDGDRNTDWFETQMDVPYFAYCSESNRNAAENLEGGQSEEAFYASSRDGCFDHKQLFAVLDKGEAVDLLEAIEFAVHKAYRGW